ncbi:MAG: VWA domain-containing protein [Bryobacterales bacterium]|nr:VWA domain-containing protein [Bryobacterales bacterium]
MSTNATSSSAAAPVLLRRGISRRREQRERGLAVMLTAIMLLFTLPAVGLAIDAGLLYVIRGRLTAACDAASLATARNLNVGLTLAEQTAAALARGDAFFRGNFPDGYLGTSGTTPSFALAQTNMSTLTVTTTATTNAPLYFMRILGSNATVAGAWGKASRRAVNLMLVLDRSGSMSGTPCADMISASKTFVDMFANQRDRLGMITFGAAAYLAYPPSQDFKNPTNTLTSKIDQITCGGWTNTAYSYFSAYQQLVAVNEPLALNMIVFFTDGVPTALTAAFPIKTVSDTRYGDGNTCATNTQCTMAKSTCTDDLGRASTNALWGTFAPKVGTLTGGSLGSGTGNTTGLAAALATSFSTSDPLIPSAQRASCQMNSSQNRVRRDVAYIPATDVNGISTSGYQSVSRFTTAGHPYINQIRPDRPDTLSKAAMNLADNAAASIRNNTTLNVITFTLGLGDVDDELLKRMANDPPTQYSTNPGYDDTKPDGLYVYAANSADLNQAFARIASEILRLAR